VRNFKNEAFEVQTKEEEIPPVKEELLAKITSKGTRSVVITWNKIEGADGYDVYFVKCGKTSKFKKIKTVKSGSKLQVTRSGLKKNTAYKAYIKAYVLDKDGNKIYIKESPDVHAFTTKGSKRYTNPKSVTVKSTNVTLNTGSNYTIKATVKRINTS
jgi:hypothetical protein